MGANAAALVMLVVIKNYLKLGDKVQRNPHILQVPAGSGTSHYMQIGSNCLTNCVFRLLIGTGTISVLRTTLTLGSPRKKLKGLKSGEQAGHRCDHAMRSQYYM